MKISLSNKKTIWIAAGGTGGHIAPGVATAQKFEENGWNVVVFTHEKNADYADIVQLSVFATIRIVLLNAPRFPSRIGALPSFFIQLMRSWMIIKAVERETRPAIIAGFGGYLSFPVILFAFLKRIPYVLHEQNSVAGVVTRLFARKARNLFLSFNETEKLFSGVVTGNPLRKVFLKSPGKKKQPKAKINSILLLGGSQGATDINNLFIAMRKDRDFDSYRLTISCGDHDYNRLKDFAHKDDRIYTFINTMEDILFQSDLVIARAGSGTIFEILWARKPSVLIPYPFAADDHQRKNALAMARAGCSELFDQRPFDSREAANYIKTVIKSSMISEMVESLNHHTFKMNGEALIYESIIKSLENN